MPEEPRCPFCHNRIKPPTDVKNGMKLEFPASSCENCGSSYVYDSTGHNMGAAALAALVFASGGDESRAYSLSYGTDYDDAVIEHYDPALHKIVPEKEHEGMPVTGTLIFVKLSDRHTASVEEKTTGESKHAEPVKTRSRPVRLSRAAIRQLVMGNLIEDLAELASVDAMILNEIQLMLYTPDEELRWRVIDVLTEVCERLEKIRPDLVRKLIEKELQNAAYPGSAPWGALETAGALISTDPDRFSEFIPVFMGFFRQENLRREFAWAAGRIARVNPDSIRYVHDTLRLFLRDEDAAVRGNAAWALGEFRLDGDVIRDLQKLEGDDERLSIWKDSELREATVSELAAEAIRKIEVPLRRG